jgi:hypothetical protein
MSASLVHPRPRAVGWLGLVLAILTVCVVPRRALACGAGTGGAAGISGCSLEEHEEEARLKWRVGASYAFTSTGLHFTGGLRVDEIRNSSVVAIDYRPVPRLTLEAGAGPFLGGSITALGTRYSLAPGFASTVGGSWRLVDADGAVPFVLLTGQLSYISTTTTPSIGYNAFDLRLGGVVGTTLWHAWTPYVVARAFGGPVYWRFNGAGVIGTDDHHWQIGGGFSLRIGSRIDLFAEGVPLGELGVAAGAGYSF